MNKAKTTQQMTKVETTPTIMYSSEPLLSLVEFASPLLASTSPLFPFDPPLVLSVDGTVLSCTSELSLPGEGVWDVT